MHHKGSSSVAFIEYQSVQQATAALHNLQGYQLSNGSQIRIEYAKSKMGEGGGGATMTSNGVKADA